MGQEDQDRSSGSEHEEAVPTAGGAAGSSGTASRLEMTGSCQGAAGFDRTSWRIRWKISPRDGGHRAKIRKS